MGGKLGCSCGCFQKIVGKPPKMDGEKNGKPLLKWMIWGGFTTPIFGNTHVFEISTQAVSFGGLAADFLVHETAPGLRIQGLT